MIRESLERTWISSDLFWIFRHGDLTTRWDPRQGVRRTGQITFYDQGKADVIYWRELFDVGDDYRPKIEADWHEYPGSRHPAKITITDMLGVTLDGSWRLPLEGEDNGIRIRIAGGSEWNPFVGVFTFDNHGIAKELRPSGSFAEGIPKLRGNEYLTDAQMAAWLGCLMIDRIDPRL